MLLEVHDKLGNQWREIAKHLPGRTENSVKNRWHSAKLALRRKQAAKAAENAAAANAAAAAANAAAANIGAPAANVGAPAANVVPNPNQASA